MKLKKGDHVKIISGKDRNKTGKILLALPESDKVVVDGLNVFKKRAKPRKQGETGQIISVSRPLPVSKVMFICSACKEPTRVGFRMDGATKVRYCKKCKATT